ncbi:MAG: DUF6468 domain-containing protein [Pseudomonadota bacterium]
MSSQVALILDGLILIFLSVTIFYAARLSMFLKTFREGKKGIQLLIRDLTTTILKAETALSNSKADLGEAEQKLREVLNESQFIADELKYMTEGGDKLASRLEKLADRNRELVALMEKSGGIGNQTIEPFEPEKETLKAKKKVRKAIPEKPYAEKKHVEPEFDTTDLYDFEKEEAYESLIDPELDQDDEEDFLALEDGAYKEKESLQAPHKVKETVSSDAGFSIFDREIAEMEIKKELETTVRETVEDHAPSFYSRAEQDLYEALQRRKKTRGGNG